MQTLLAIYAVAWAAVSVYVIRLAATNARLARRLDRLETQQVAAPHPCGESQSRAA